MNKELIEKLESVGFSKKEQAGNVLSLHIKGLKFLYYIGIDEFCVHSSSHHFTQIKSPSFVQISKTVEKYSNIELQNVHLSHDEEVFKRLTELNFKPIEGVDCGIERRIKDNLIQYSKSTKILDDDTRIHYTRLTHHKFFDGFPKAKKSIKNPTVKEAEQLIESVFGKDFISKQQGNGLLDIAHSEGKPKQTQRKEVVCFSKEMEGRLRENDNKGGWKNCSNSRLLTGLKNNVSKLDTVIDEKTLLDVANYAMMLFDNNIVNVNYSEDNPKQTKSQRISQLENQIEVLTTNLQKVEDMVKDKSLIVDENTKAINKNKELIKQEVNDLNSLRALVLEINARLNKLERNNSLETAQKVLEATKEIGNLALELKKLENESDGRVLAKVEANENILPKNVAEALTDKPKFKVGDKVVLKKDVVIKSEFDCTGLKIGQEKGTVWTIESFKDFNMVHIISGYSAWTTKVSYLEHAPKLKLGAWAEIIGKTGDHFFKIGEKVLIGALDVEEGYVCSTADTWYYVKKEDLKPL